MVRPRHESTWRNVEAGMEMKSGSDTFTVVKILQNAIKRDRPYNGESGFQADGFQMSMGSAFSNPRRRTSD